MIGLWSKHLDSKRVISVVGYLVKYAKPTIWGIRTLRNISYDCLRRLITSRVQIVVGFLSLHEPILVPARFASAHRFCPLNSVYVRSSQSVLLENVCTP